MSKRAENMMKAISNLTWDKRKSRYCLSYSEMCELYKIQNSWDRMDCAFSYGFIKGMRYMKKVGGING